MTRIDLNSAQRRKSVTRMVAVLVLVADTLKVREPLSMNPSRTSRRRCFDFRMVDGFLRYITPRELRGLRFELRQILHEAPAIAGLKGRARTFGLVRLIREAWAELKRPDIKPAAVACAALLQPSRGDWVERVFTRLEHFQPSAAPAPASADKANGAIELKRLRTLLDDMAVGQTEAKDALAVAGWRHLRSSNGEKGLPRTSLLLAGPTGSGKTLLCRGLAEGLGLPYVDFSATQLSQSGYTGSNVEDILLRLLKNAGNDKAKAEFGVVFIDECDKIRMRSNLDGDTRDIKGRGVQEELLSVIEGACIHLNTRANGKGETEINTQNMLFILGGAFSEMEELRKEKRRTKSAIGFQAEGGPATAEPTGIDNTDLIQWGFIPELVGRIGQIVQVHALTPKQLGEIASRPGSGLVHGYSRLLKSLGVELEVTPAFYEALAQRAAQNQIGARGLRSEFERLLTPLLLQDHTDTRLVVLDVGLDGEPSALRVCAQKSKEGKA